MRIKKKYKNEYLLTSFEDKIWVRNFTQKAIFPVDINHLLDPDFKIILDNEIQNNILQIEKIDAANFVFPKCVIVSDGYKFEEKQSMLAKLPKDVTILGVNDALKKWNAQRAMNFFVVNNPYKECLNLLPTKHSYYPRCIISTRTYHKFPGQYRGYLYKYSPTAQENYECSKAESLYKVDDYRNPICACINLSYHFQVKKLLLFCCDESFENQRPGAEQLDNKLWHYPQHRIAHNIIDANLYWLKEAGVEVKNHSSGPNFSHATYISEEDMCDFFQGIK